MELLIFNRTEFPQIYRFRSSQDRSTIGLARCNKKWCILGFAVIITDKTKEFSVFSAPHEELQLPLTYIG